MNFKKFKCLKFSFKFKAACMKHLIKFCIGGEVKCCLHKSDEALIINELL